MSNHQLFTKVKKGIFSLAFFTTMNSIGLKAQEGAVVKLSRYEVTSETKKHYSEAIKSYVLYSLGDTSNILSEAFYDQDNASAIWIIERWSDRSALEKATGSRQFSAIEKLSSGLKPGPDVFYVTDLEPITREKWRANENVTGNAITVMLFIDSKPGTEGRFKQIYHNAMPQFRSEPGVINYQLSQFQDDSTKFVTYEKFKDEEAFQYHLNFPPIKPVLDYLNTDIKSQPFQKGLHKLVAFASLSHK